MKEENVTNKKQSVELVTNCDRLPLNVESLFLLPNCFLTYLIHNK